MPKYIVERYLEDLGWCRGIPFPASDEEDAKKQAMLKIGGLERLSCGDAKMRILRVTFEGFPFETGYPYPQDSKIERIVEEHRFRMEEMQLAVRQVELDYRELGFALQTVPEVLDGAGHDLRLLYASGYGFMGSATKEEVAHAISVAKLKPEDVTLSAYYIRGRHGSQCVSLSKVISFEKDGKTPQQLIHLWPLELDNLAIDLVLLKDSRAEIKDERSK